MASVLTVLYATISLLSPGVLPDWMAGLHVNIILGVLLILALLPQLGDSWAERLPDTYYMAGLLLAVGASTAASGWLGHIPAEMYGFFSIEIVAVSMVISFRKLSQIRLMTWALLGVGLFIFFQGEEAMRLGEMQSLYLFHEGPLLIRYRGLGFLNDPNDLAQFYDLLIPLLWVNWRKGRSLTNILFCVVPAAILITAVFYTHSRGGSFGLIAAVLFGFKDKLGTVRSAILAAILMVALLALNVGGGRGMDEDDGARVEAWSSGLTIFKSHPAFGVGVGNFGDYNDRGITAHNSYVLALSETGIVGYFFWMGIIVSNFVGVTDMVRAKKKVLKENALAGVPAGRGFGRGGPTLTEAAALGRAATPVYLRANPVETPAYAFPAPATRGAYAAGSLGAFGSQVSNETETEDAQLLRAGQAIRAGMVGLLTASFFLSRTYAMSTFVSFGLAGALRMIYYRRHPDALRPLKPMTKTTLIVIFFSVIFLYLFIRYRSSHP